MQAVSIQSSLPPLTVARGSERPCMKSHTMVSLSHAAESAEELKQSLQFIFTSDSSQEDSPRSEKRKMPTLKKFATPVSRDHATSITSGSNIKSE